MITISSLVEIVETTCIIINTGVSSNYNTFNFLWQLELTTTIDNELYHAGTLDFNFALFGLTTLVYSLQ